MVFKVVFTALGMLLLFSGGLLFAEGRRRWLLAGAFGALAILCLFIGKGGPWVILALVAIGAALYFARPTPPVEGKKK